MKIDKNLYHKIQLKKVQLVELNCKFNEDIKINTEKQIPINIHMNSSSKIISDNSGISYLKVDIGFESKEKAVFSISVTYKGICETIGKVSEDELAFFLDVQSVPMLWAYVRETVNNIMLKMNLPPIVLPVINVTDVIKRFQIDAEREGGEKEVE